MLKKQTKKRKREFVWRVRLPRHGQLAKKSWDDGASSDVEATELRSALPSTLAMAAHLFRLASIFWKAPHLAEHCSASHYKEGLYLAPPLLLVVLLCWTSQWSPTCSACVMGLLLLPLALASGMVGSSSARRRRRASSIQCPSSAPLKNLLCSVYICNAILPH